VRLHEASTGAPYWLYLPAGYEDAPTQGGSPKRYPLVMTFHGMKPFDNDHSQIREWQQEADRYGFVVCAPELLVSDLMGPLPLNRADHPSLQRDERAVIAVMDELYRTTNVDPNRVLATSWSYGGYIAHYMANRYPERFSCLAVRQSNFNADILDESTVPRYRDHKVGIFFTENDFAVCRRESSAAAEWYARHGFDLTHAVFEKKGHERTPGIAAEFFARTIGVEPKTPPEELATMQVLATPRAPFVQASSSASTTTNQVPAADFLGNDGANEPVEVAVAQRPGGSLDRPPGTAARQEPRPPATTAGRETHPSGGNAPGTSTRGVPLQSRPVADARLFDPPSTRLVRPPSEEVSSPVRIRASSTIGVAPLLVSYSVVAPAALARGASALWLANGEPISNGLNGQRYFRHPGDHRLEVLLTAADGTEYRSTRTITVIERAGTGTP